MCINNCLFVEYGKNNLKIGSGVCQTHLVKQISYLSDFCLNAKSLIIEGLYEFWDYENLDSSSQPAIILTKLQLYSLKISQFGGGSMTLCGTHQFITYIELNSFNT